jgi:hypothetical protein
LIGGVVVVLLLVGAWATVTRPWADDSTSSLTTLTPTDAPITSASASTPVSASASAKASAKSVIPAPEIPSTRKSPKATPSKTSTRKSPAKDSSNDDPDDGNIEGDGDGTNPIPTKFRGYWEGTFALSSGADTPITAQSDDVAGNIVLTMPKLGCGGFMDFKRATTATLRLDARVTYDADDKCDQFGHGVVTWTLASKNELVMVWQEADNPDQTVFNTDLQKN